VFSFAASLDFLSLRHLLNPSPTWWRGEDSNLRRHKPADLQSAPVGRFGTSPFLHTTVGTKKGVRSPFPLARTIMKKWFTRIQGSTRCICTLVTLGAVAPNGPSGVELTGLSLVSVLIPATPKNPAAIPAGADDGTRTRNLLITNQLLYQLSYVSMENRAATIRLSLPRSNARHTNRAHL
jgi:hypothetical protein